VDIVYQNLLTVRGNPIHTSYAMSQDEFTKLFTYMQREFGSLRAEMAALRAELKADVDRLYSLHDQSLKRLETGEQERLAINHQLDRHERWHHKTAKHIGIQLEH
jgi:hypothetical protein